MTPSPALLSDFERGVEAALFASTGPLSPADLAAYIGAGASATSGLGGGDVAVRAALAAIQARHAGTGIELVERSGRWHFQTPGDLAHLLRREREQPRRLSRAALEVLAIIAYHEPVSRAEIEAIRGVQTAKGTLDVLMEAGWVRPAGRREAPGRPLIYKTTPDFLVHFGLTSRRDLPGLDDLRAAGLLEPVDVAFDALELAQPGDNA